MMEQTETDLVNKRLTEETMMRQQQILTRLLEVEKSARERDQDTKREAQAAQNKPPVFPPAFDKYKASKERQTELLRSTPTDPHSLLPARSGRIFPENEIAGLPIQ